MSFNPQALAQDLSWHFLCGHARLSIVADDFAPAELTPCAAEAAVVLDLAGELLDGLAAAGLLTASDWQWVAGAGGMAAGAAQALWRGAEAEARLSLPWTALRSLDRAPELAGLQWQPTPAECLLAQWRLSDEEVAALEPGGLLLLERDATAELRARGEAVAGEPWQLVARWEQPLPVEVVMGWRGGHPALPVACLLVDVARPEVVRARGRLIPWGSGQAFRIDAI